MVVFPADDRSVLNGMAPSAASVGTDAPTSPRRTLCDDRLGPLLPTGHSRRSHDVGRGLCPANLVGRRLLLMGRGLVVSRCVVPQTAGDAVRALAGDVVGLAAL